jgi:hypothetical protein
LFVLLSFYCGLSFAGTNFANFIHSSSIYIPIYASLQVFNKLEGIGREGIVQLAGVTEFH